MGKERIVITGMGAVTPVGIGVTAYWENLAAGKSGISHITRFDTDELPVQIAAEVQDFYPQEFLPKKLVRNTDIFMQFALIAAKEALAQSRLDADPERIGIVMGTALGGISTVAETQAAITEKGKYRVSPHVVPKMLGNIGAAQIAIMHGIKGPSLTVNTACSSGADAIGTASMLLKADQADVVIAVGAESILSGLMTAGLHSARALSTNNADPEKASRPFDLKRDGFVMGEGAGAIVLEKLGRAKTRGAEIHAELLGYANNTDAYHVTSPEPHGYGEVRCMQQALREAGLTADAIDYINAHGTSTKLGDEVETTAIKSLF
ncbi:beta-ketoacyl-[acyl-carrier-protein] synthase family protein [Virgibacillus halophilus]|uniref:Beta-ketoacyl-[acyl-carrier-protein] synthase family protein n=2 Tax=Tigheibacillus halophilus TaxID=361280 RepID=A0ABU5C6W8_9BACI|nr:beta-ketoacyl-[acyl-carrier-protein] synthase family protein [Virgibacillus halophilus]